MRQARRVTALLLGAPGWPGLVERLATGGPSALREPVLDAAVLDRLIHEPGRLAILTVYQYLRSAS